ncbi:MAG: hypothetical protein ABJ275_10035 [Maricaulaceae bacterium]
MKDYLFYPFCALVVGAIIYYALSFTVEVEPIDVSGGFEIKGEQLQYLLIPERLECTLISDKLTGTSAVSMTSNVNKETAPPSAGISARLGLEFEQAFSGKTLIMTVRARASEVNPSPSFQMGYFAIGANSSGWKDFDLTENYENYSFKFNKTVPTGDTGGDFAGIWPDVDGFGRGMVVESIKVEIAAEG